MVNCTWSFHIATEQDRDGIVAELDRVMGHLLDLEEADPRLEDSSLGLDLDTMSVEIGIAAEGETFEDGLATAMGAIRTAIHAAGGSTPDWPSMDDLMPADTEDGLVFERGELVAC